MWTLIKPLFSFLSFLVSSQEIFYYYFLSLNSTIKLCLNVLHLSCKEMAQFDGRLDAFIFTSSSFYMSDLIRFFLMNSLYSVYCFTMESFREMNFQERNLFIAEAWNTHLKPEEREDLNFRAQNEPILTLKEQTKRTLERTKRKICHAALNYPHKFAITLFWWS